MICISMYSTCLSIYNTPKKETNTSRNVGTWTLWGRHHQSTIVETLFGIFFWFTTLYRVQHVGINQLRQSAGAAPAEVFLMCCP